DCHDETHTPRDNEHEAPVFSLRDPCSCGTGRDGGKPQSPGPTLELHPELRNRRLTTWSPAASRNWPTRRARPAPSRRFRPVATRTTTCPRVVDIDAARTAAFPVQDRPEDALEGPAADGAQGAQGRAAAHR